MTSLCHCRSFQKRIVSARHAHLVLQPVYGDQGERQPEKEDNSEKNKW